MLQASEIQRRFTHIGRTIGKAAEACRADSNLPKHVRDSVQLLDRQALLAAYVLESDDHLIIRQTIDALERLGHRAEKACGESTTQWPEVRNAVVKAHSDLAELRRALH